MWRSFAQEIEKFFVNGFGINFLNNNLIRQTMFMTGKPKIQKIELDFLKENYASEQLKNLLKEEAIGCPTISSFQYKTSQNSIHHLYHLTKYSKETGCDLTKLSKIIEWGGGYGNMARIMMKINPSVNYIIVDLPIFGIIQAIYLATVLGPQKVRLLGNNTESGAGINIVPAVEPMLNKLSGADLFISTWALSESSDYAQKFVEKNKFFNAEAVLIAHQKKSEDIQYAEDIQHRLINAGLTIKFREEISMLKNNYYIFAEKK
jgi:hypothetical protein